MVVHKWHYIVVVYEQPIWYHTWLLMLFSKRNVQLIECYATLMIILLTIVSKIWRGGHTLTTHMMQCAMKNGIPAGGPQTGKPN
jgi:hypothetical protein